MENEDVVNFVGYIHHYSMLSGLFRIPQPIPVPNAHTHTRARAHTQHKHNTQARVGRSCARLKVCRYCGFVCRQGAEGKYGLVCRVVTLLGYYIKRQGRFDVGDDVRTVIYLLDSRRTVRMIDKQPGRSVVACCCCWFGGEDEAASRCESSLVVGELFEGERGGGGNNGTVEKTTWVEALPAPPWGTLG